MSLFPNELQLQKALQYLTAPAGSIDIDEDLKKKVERWECADQLIRRHGDIGKVINLLKRQFNYSEASARRDINSATYLFGSLLHVEVKYWQRFSIELLVKMMTKAEAADEYKAFAALNREFRETVGINAKNQGIPLLGQLQRHTFIISDDYRNAEDEGVLTREEIEQQTALLLAKYKVKEEREIQVTPPEDGGS